jgi:hypothetical protein
VLDHPRLLVLSAPLDQIFLMKLLAGRATDTDDLTGMWPLTSFRTPEDAADAFHAAYPHEEHDPNLATWIGSIVTPTTSGDRPGHQAIEGNERPG